MSSKVEFLVHFFERFFAFQKGIHQKIFAIVPFSAGDLFYVFLGLLLLFFIYKISKKTTRNQYLIKLLIVVNILYFTYQIFWGMLYFKEPMIKQFKKVENTQNQAEKLSIKYLNLCIESRKFTQEDQNGVFKITDFATVERKILQGQNNLPDFVGQRKGYDINSFKPSLYKGIMSYTGILGYYNPFTAEAQYNSQLPATYLPFTLAHESMHQFGIAREKEANFTAYLIGENSDNLDLKYSTDYFVLKSLLNSLVEKNPDFVKEVLENYSPAMKRDRAAEIIFREKHQGFLETFFGYTNDLFLKSNQQEGSITYSYFVELLIRYETQIED